jgi:hypothetical protein
VAVFDEPDARKRFDVVLASAKVQLHPTQRPRRPKGR